MTSGGAGGIRAKKAFWITLAVVVATIVVGAAGTVAVSWLTSRQGSLRAESLLRALMYMDQVFPVIAGVIGAILFAQLQWRQRKRETAIERGIDVLEEKAKESTSLADFATALLDAAAERQALLMHRSERRLGILYIIGTGLVVLGVLVPFLHVSMYATQDVVSAVTALRQQGVEPVIAADLARCDWHLLAGGVSLGLLFLAAARGLLTAERPMARPGDDAAAV